MPNPVVRQLALQYPQSPLNAGSLLVYLTARDASRGEAAVKALHEEEQLRKAKVLVTDGGPTEIKFRQLDIGDEKSVDAFADFVRKEHPDKIDFVINNAGVAFEGFSRSPHNVGRERRRESLGKVLTRRTDDTVVKDTLQINYYGTLQATEAFLPLLKPTGRLVNVASMAGHLSKYSPALKRRFLNVQSVEDATQLMQEFASAVSRNHEKQEGWPSAAYAVSKAGVIAFTRAIAAREKKAGSEKLVNACCPGWVVTSMTKGKGHKTPDQGAQTPVMLAIQDIGGKTGEFWQDEKIIEW